jgi:hypothetical protein
MLYQLSLLFITGNLSMVSHRKASGRKKAVADFSVKCQYFTRAVENFDANVIKVAVRDFNS